MKEKKHLESGQKFLLRELPVSVVFVQRQKQRIYGSKIQSPKKIKVSSELGIWFQIWGCDSAVENRKLFHSGHQEFDRIALGIGDQPLNRGIYVTFSDILTLLRQESGA